MPGSERASADATPPAGAADPLRRLQLQELELLTEFARRCDAASLRWYVLGGTLLGAVRHGGFIPWDDDVDVGMPRSDYERFEALAGASRDARFEWQSLRTERRYPFVYGKLLLAGTDVVDPAVAHLRLRPGVFIDVFPLDGAPGPGRLQLIHRIGLKLAVTAIGAHVRRSGVRALAAVALRPVPRSLAIGVLEAFARRVPFDASPFAVNAGGAWGYGRECQPRARFEPSARLSFEGTDVRVPGRWREYLAQVYGDFERLPPPAARRPRHGLTRVSAGESR